MTCSSTLNISSGRVTSSSQTSYFVDDTITVECDEGFELNSSLQSNVITCLDTGDWSFSDFDNICVEIQGKKSKSFTLLHFSINVPEVRFKLVSLL